ncbi:MAG: two pore domain potassium channel family protein [Proteobacteria bacterium]|nr:two pore domain potassium channel family protein [Pseudomonadota bacterium]
MGNVLDAAPDWISISVLGFVVGSLASMLVVVLCVVVHYEGLNLLERLSVLESRWLKRARPRLVLIMLGVVALHVLEIWLFAGVYGLMEHMGLGTVVRAMGTKVEHGVLDLVYYSSTVYTTLGFGDLVPSRSLRVVSGSEALLGLILIGWSTSFTFVLMQRLWGKRR